MVTAAMETADHAHLRILRFATLVRMDIRLVPDVIAQFHVPTLAEIVISMTPPFARAAMTASTWKVPNACPAMHHAANALDLTLMNALIVTQDHI